MEWNIPFPPLKLKKGSRRSFIDRVEGRKKLGLGPWLVVIFVSETLPTWVLELKANKD